MNFKVTSKKLFLGSLLLFLASPHLSGFFPNPKKLAGTLEKQIKPKFSFQNFLDGTFQKSFSKFFTNNLGFRASFVRTDNQINYSLFGDTSRNLGTIIMPGHDNFLIEQSYVHSFNRANPIPRKSLDNIAIKLLELQTKLRNRGIAFSLVVSPSKAEIYPENIPLRFIHPKRKERQDDYQLLIERLEALNINLIDGVKIAKNLKAKSSYPVFPPGGIHWSYLTACKTSQILIESLESQIQKEIQRPRCEPIKLRDSPWGTDRDMLNLLNLLDESPWHTPLPQPPMKESFFEPEKYHPTVLIVGDSFVWTPLHFFDKDGTFRKRRFMYYFSTEYNYWTSTRDEKFKYKTSIREHKGKVKVNWDSILEDRDAVVIFANQTSISQTGFGFVEAALSYLDKN